MSIYNTINMLSTFYRKEEAIDCLDLNVNYDEMKALLKGREDIISG